MGLYRVIILSDIYLLSLFLGSCMVLKRLTHLIAHTREGMTAASDWQ
jgi:hypothetical protein